LRLIQLFAAAGFAQRNSLKVSYPSLLLYRFALACDGQTDLKRFDAERILVPAAEALRRSSTARKKRRSVHEAKQGTGRCAGQF
jgi:hypothetical protein